MGTAASVRLAPVAVGDRIELGNGLRTSVTRVIPLDIESVGPGETAGPGVLVDIQVENPTDAAVDLSPIAVTVEGPTGEIGIPVTTQASSPHHGLVDPGATQSATYLFRLDEERLGITVEVSHGGVEDILVVET